MAMGNADWSRLCGSFYSKRPVYEMLWEDVDLSKYLVAMAPYGGPIAIVRDSRKVQLYDAESKKPLLRIYTASGQLISSTPWDFSSSLIKLDWSDREALVAVFSDGSVHVFSIHGEETDSFSLGKDVKDRGVGDAVVWGGGMVVRTAGTSGFDLYIIPNLEEPRPRRLAANSLTSPPASMAVIPPQFTQSRSAEILLASKEGSIIVVDEKNAEDQVVNTGPFTNLVVSPDGTKVACFNTEGTLYITSTDFTQNFCKFETQSKSKKTVPVVAWVGVNAVALYWEALRMVLMVGVGSPEQAYGGDFVKYQFAGRVELVTEVDGLRVVTAEHCYFLHRVPSSTEAIFGISSTKPAACALLFDAAEAFEQEDAKADENIRAIADQDTLNTAIEQCLDAAASEFDYQNQRNLLKAASYGGLFSENWDADAFVDTCRTMRVLNAVRNPKVGLPLTFAQFQDLGPRVLVDRLVNRHQHLLAMRVCNYLRIPPEPVLVHWGCAKIRMCDDQEDEQLAAVIIDKLQDFPNISYSKIATTAFHNGRRRLATLLLEREPKASEQVPLLLNMKEDTLALEKAIESCDTDLVHMALIHLQRSGIEEKEFFEIVQRYPLARNLFISNAKAQCDFDALKSYYYTFGMRAEAAQVAVLEAYRCTSWKERMEGLKIARAFFTKDTVDKNSPFNAKAADEQIKLLEWQQKQELELQEPIFIDTSLSQMIETYISHGQLKKAEQLKSEFRVPEKRFWHIHVQTLASIQAWPDLERLGLQRKRPPPIGYLPFIEVAVEAKRMDEAAKYIHRLDDYVKRMEWFCNIGLWTQAADVAVAEKDRPALEHMYQVCRDPSQRSYIESKLRGATF